MILLRIVLIGLVVYLIIRSFVRYAAGEDEKIEKTDNKNGQKPVSKRVSKEIGEYIDYEEIKKK